MILQYKSIDVFYTDEGSGNPVVLLHGFLEDHTMWSDISSELVKTNRVITIDLLGHGKTGCLGDVHLMEDMASAVDAVLNHLKIEALILAGHSMGGYVALAYAENNIPKVKGLCLMNSTFEADDEERKALRTRANKMVRDNFKNMVRMSFANLFSEYSKKMFKPAFQAALQIALKTPILGYIAAQEGMRLRKDQTMFFKNSAFIKAILLGEKDSVLNSKAIEAFAKTNEIPVTLFAEGHMSHIENKTECINSIMHFVENINHFSD